MTLAFWAYILRCADDRFYTGHTDNLDARIAQHSTGDYCDFTSRRLPVHLAWSQEFPSRLEALEAERRVKSWSRAKKHALINDDWAAVSYFALPPKERPSTSLGTNGGGAPTVENDNEFRKIPFVSSPSAAPFGGRSGQAKVETRTSKCEIP